MKFARIPVQGVGAGMKKALLSVLLLAVGLLAGCGGSSNTSTGGGGNTVTLVSISITPAAPSISSGGTLQFTATGNYSDGTTKNLTSSANWLSSNTAVASVNTSGLATGGATGGTTTISATSGTVTGSTTLTVVALHSIAVTPPAATVAPNGTQQFTATGNYSDGSTKNLTSTVTWSATAGATITQSGLATGVTPNTTSTITATQGSIVSNAAVLTITNPLVSIAVTPATVSVSPIAPNNNQQFTATGTFADGSTQNLTNSVAWSASTGATITQGGLATAMAPNTTVTIQAAQGNIVGNATMTITNPLVSIAVSSPTQSIAPGTKVNFTATGTYADNSTQVITTTVTWSSSDTTLATISNSPGTQGQATAIKAGTVTITATSGSITGTSTLTVTNATLSSIAVTPAGAQIVLATQQQYTAIGTYSDSSTQDITNSVTWASNDNAHLTITVSGKATGVGTTNNPVTISATQGAVSGSTTATVIPPTLVSINITPNVTTMAQGTAQQLTATGVQSNGSTLNLTTLATWTSSNPSVASVGIHNGLVRAQSVTTTTPVTIQASYNGVQQSITIDVTNATPTSITVTPISASIPAGVNQTFVATATFSDGSQQNVSNVATWSSDNSAVATVNTVGAATGVAPGLANISASFGGQGGLSPLTVNTATLTSISVATSKGKNSAFLAPGSTASFVAVGQYSDSSTYSITFQSGVVWSSSDTSVATIQLPGTVFGQAPGSASITASYQGVTSNQANVVVNSSPLVSIAVVPATSTVPFGVSVAFQATGTFQDGTTQDLTTSVTWASSDPTVATISNAVGKLGLATGVSAGQAIITALFAGIAGNATLNVSNATLTSITVAPHSKTLSPGNTFQFTATGTFSDSTTINLTTQAAWSSDNALAATMSPSGLASAVAAGVANLTAAFVQNGVTVSDTAILTVQ